MILVTGATGKNGVEILKRLSGRIERVRAMVRKPGDAKSSTPARAWNLSKAISTIRRACERC